MRRRIIAISAIALVVFGGGAVAVAAISKPSHAQKTRHQVVRVQASQAQAPVDVQGAYAAFRRSARGDDEVPHAPVGSVGRLVSSDAAAEVYLLSTPGERLCVVALVRAGNFGGTACGPEELAASRPPALGLQRGADGETTLFGAAPDNVRGVTVQAANGVSSRAQVVGNLYSVQVPTAVVGITLEWADGTRSSLGAR